MSAAPRRGAPAMDPGAPKLHPGPDKTGIADASGSGSAPRVTVSAGPNPAAESATILVNLPQAADMKIEVYDVRGALVSTVANGSFPAGNHVFAWRAADGRSRGPGSGVYFARVTVDGTGHVRKIIVLR